MPIQIIVPEGVLTADAEAEAFKNSPISCSACMACPATSS